MIWMRVGISVASVLFSIVLMEGGARLVLEPVDFLKPRLIDDPILGHRIAEGSAGHDDWGFRNRGVPDSVDIVAIGDSQTYGVSALAFDSWPAWLGRLSGQSTYNMALGGWGPVQYEHLLAERALPMNPSAIVLGLYFGNDIFDAHRVVYGLDHWRELRLAGRDELASPYKSVERERDDGVIANIRIWLGRHSILYRLTANTFGQFAGRLELRFGNADPRVVHLQDPDFETGFTPASRLSAIDFTKPEIEVGYAITKSALVRMVERCKAHGVRLIVLLIPTKETVFEERLSGRKDLPQATEIERLLAAERAVRLDLTEFLNEQGISVVDPLPSMRAASRSTAIYPSNAGGHPVSAGYQAIADAVLAELNTQPPTPSSPQTP